jgi:predicted nucleic acid-binding protein
MSVVIDASVVVKFFVRESHSELAFKLLNSQENLVAPDHFLGEVGEVLLRRLRAGEIEPQQLRIAATFIAGTIEPIAIAPLFELAATVAVEASISFYDALYIAAAVREGTVAITADERLLRRLRGTQWEDRAVSLEAWGRVAPATK